VLNVRMTASNYKLLPLTLSFAVFSALQAV